MLMHVYIYIYIVGVCTRTDTLTCTCFTLRMRASTTMDLLTRACSTLRALSTYLHDLSNLTGGTPTLFSRPLFQLPMTTSYSLGASHRILERRDIPTHRDSAGGVHLRPPPPKWADGHWLQ